MSTSNDQPKQPQMRTTLMKLTKQGGFSNTSLVGNITYRQAISIVIVSVVGVVLLTTPVFKWNFLAIAAYVALASLVLGQTPTQRSVMKNIYGIVFRKPTRLVVSEHSTTTTLGHGIREVILDEPDEDATPFKMHTGHYAFVYNVTSNINRWSTTEDFISQAIEMKKLFNIMQGTEGIIIVDKQDSDTGMFQLRDTLLESEKFEGDDLQRMSNRRRDLLTSAATSTQSRSIQQYMVVLVRPRNTKRVLNAMKDTSRITRPATNPADVLLAISGLEGGVEKYGFVQKDEKETER